MIHRKNQIFFIAACLFSVFPLFAQENANDKELENIIIDGNTISLPFSQTSANVQIITKQQIEQSPSTSIAELLSYSSGVDIRQRGVHGVQADISIRGSSNEQVLVLINGIRLSDSQTGHNMMNLPFSMASVERIEIIKGPAARRFGQNAYAGVINIITKPLDVDDVVVSALGGEFGTYSLGAGINLAGKKFSQFVQAETSHSDGYRYNTDYSNKNVWYQNSYKLKNGDLHLQGGVVEKKFGANGFYSTASAQEYEETQTSLLSFGTVQKFGNFRLNADAYWRRSQDMYLNVRSNPAAYRNMHIGNNVGINVNSNYKWKLGVTGAGVEVRKEFLASNNLGAHNQFITSIFLDHHLTLLDDKLDITPGVNFADYEDFGSFWYPGIDIGYRLNENNKIFANVGKTYRVPTYTDIYYSGPNNEGNPDLKPENAWSYELGYRFNNKNILATVSLFHRESKNLIDWTKQNEADKWKPENIAHVNTGGVEMDFTHRFFVSFIKSYSVGYTYIDNELKKTKGFSKYAFDNLRHQLVVKLEHKIVKNFTNQIVWRYNDRATLSNYNLLDDRLNYQLKNFSIFMQINNITNAKYIETNLVPMPGRWLEIGATFKNVF
ncbi:MAG: TonB-dependent receptor [Prevotellaceae bacterium]|nr:TonB-dependent receptor [Prevotellaceae bacterium]